MRLPLQVEMLRMGIWEFTCTVKLVDLNNLKRDNENKVQQLEVEEVESRPFEQYSSASHDKKSSSKLRLQVCARRIGIQSKFQLL